MLPAAILALLAILPASESTYVNCNIACRKCKDGSMSTSVREIYCAMCKECRARLRERALRAYRRNLMDDGIIDVDGLEPDKQALRFRDAGAVNKDDTIINMGAPIDNLKLIDELPREGADDGFMENTDAVKDDPDNGPIIANDVTQPTTEQTSRKPLPKQYRTKRVATIQTDPLENLFDNSLETLAENDLDDTFRDNLKKDIPDGCPTPPLCSDTEDDEAVPSYHPTAPPTSPTPPPTTTTLPPTTCPPVATCKPKRKRTTALPSNNIPCMPCMPWCPAICNNQNPTQWNPWNWNWPPNPNMPNRLGPNGQNVPQPGSLSPNDSWKFSSEPPLFSESPDSTPTPAITTPVPTTCWPLQMTCGPVQPHPGESATMSPPPAHPQTPTTVQDFIYVYVGVPKELERKK